MSCRPLLLLQTVHNGHTVFQVQSELTSVWVTPAAFRLVISYYCMRATSAGGLGPRMSLPAVFETRVFLLCVVTSSQRKQPWMKQVDSTFPQIRPPNQDTHNRTCVRKQSKRSVNWSGSLELMSQMFQGVRRVQYSSTVKVCYILGLMQKKKLTNQFLWSK